MAAKVTSRQQQVIDGLKAGKEPKTIASEMKISVNGVYGHMRRLKQNGMSSLIANGRKSNGRKRGRASTSRRRPSSNGSRKNGSQRMNPLVGAVLDAKAQAKNRISDIEQEEKKLADEKAALTAAVE